MKIAFWVIVVIFAGYVTTAGLISFAFGDKGELCTTSSGVESCEWDWGAAAFSGFYLILFALLLVFSSRSLMGAIQNADFVWHKDKIIGQTLLVLGSLVALLIVRHLLSGLAPDLPCLAPNPTGSVWTEDGRFDEVECASSAWWETLLPWVVLLASSGIGAVSVFRLRHGRHRPQTPTADLGLAA